MRFEVYPDKSGQWRWRLKARNGRIVADGAEGYTRRADCYKAVERINSWFDVEGRADCRGARRLTMP